MANERQYERNARNFDQQIKVQDYEHPLQVTITLPSEEPRREGLYSTKHPDSGMVYCRLNRFDNILLEKISNELGIKIGTFVRQCAVKVAHELERLQNENQQPHKPR